MQYYIPVLVYLIAGVAYQIIAKTTPASANPFAMLTVVYGIATVLCFVFALLTRGAYTLAQAYSSIPKASVILGFCVIALEASMIYAYRLGWEASVFPTVVYISMIILLLFVGCALFHEKLTARKLIGVALCIAGLVCMRQR